jgi:putative toxin-antitoxin system antitoxin component (TIGR02293 family)
MIESKTSNGGSPVIAFPQDQTLNAIEDLGLNANTHGEVIELLETGLPFAAFKHLQQTLETTEQTLAQAINVASATLARRKKAGRFSPEESDRLLRIGRLTSQSQTLFSTSHGAATWFAKPARALGGKTPLEYARTEVGAREVEALLERLLDGQAL